MNRQAAWIQRIPFQIRILEDVREAIRVCRDMEDVTEIRKQIEKRHIEIALERNGRIRACREGVSVGVRSFWGVFLALAYLPNRKSVKGSAIGKAERLSVVGRGK